MPSVKIKTSDWDSEEPKTVCIIALVGDSLRVQPPDSKEGLAILAKPQYDPGGRGMISAEDEPERFLELLQYTYSNGYLWATPPQETDQPEAAR
jgi:hypothetical protein